MSNPPAIMQQLKTETDDLHSYAERRPLQRDMLKGSIPEVMFAAYLGQLLCVHRALESALVDHRAAHRAISSVFRDYQRREADLHADLKFMSVDPQSVEPLTSTAQLIKQIDRAAAQQPLALLGMLYVLEGSTNGSKFIAKSLMRTKGMQPGQGLRYLDPYGDAQTDRWQAFKQDMDAAGFTEDEAAILITAAKVMFQGIADISDEVYEPITA